MTVKDARDIETVEERSLSLDDKVRDVEDDCDGELAGSGGKDQELSLRMRILLCTLMMSTTLGPNFSTSSTSPLKATLKRELGVNNSQYGVIASAGDLVNTVLPIIGGILIDWYGPKWGSIVSSIFIVIGCVIDGVAATTDSYHALVGGKIIFGFGHTCLQTAQSKLYYGYFSKRGMALVFALDIAFGRIVNVVGKVSAVPISEGTGSYAWTFWVAAIIAAFTFVINLVYVLIENRLPASGLVATGRTTALQKGCKGALFSARSLIRIPSWFWMLCLSQLFQSSAVQAFNSISADLIKEQHGTTEALAGYTSSVTQIIPIFLTPFLGQFFDSYGRRTVFITGTAALWILVIALLRITEVHPLVPMVFSSVALSFNAIPFIASIPLLCPDHLLIGTAFGVWKAFNNCGGVIMDIIVGRVQDITPGQTYHNVVYLIIGIKALDVVWGLIYAWADKRYLMNVLAMSERARETKIDEMGQETWAASPTWGVRKPASWSGILVLSGMIIAAWCIFFVFYLV